jgi:hypothetical protein
LTICAYSQIPQGFSYQAVIRDANGEPIVNQNVTLRFSIQRQGFPDTFTAYIETHVTATNELGMVNLVVGAGASIYGSWNDIEWEQSNPQLAWFLTVEVNAGNGFVFLGSPILQSVPYAEFSKNNWSFNGNVGTDGTPQSIGTTDYEPIHLITDNEPRLTISENGAVGIGTDVPYYPLEVEYPGGTGMQVRSTSIYSTIDIDAYSGDAALRFFEQGNGRWNMRNGPDTDDLEFYELGGGGLRLILQRLTGNLGIGTGLPESKLHIVGGTDASLTLDGYVVCGETTESNMVIDNNEIIARNDGTASDLYLNATGGGVVISSSAATTHDLLVNGTAAKPGGGSWTATSDARLKDNILPYTKGLEEVLRIDPVTYHYIENTGHDTSVEHVGVIAQELQNVAPEMVQETEMELLDGSKGNYLNVDPSALTYMLINGMKDQQIMIEELQKQNAQLASQVKDLNDRLLVLTAGTE